MLPYTAVDMITTMDRTFAFDDNAPAPATCNDHAMRRSRQMLLAAAITFFATTFHR